MGFNVNESDFENMVIRLLKEEGYEYINGRDIGFTGIETGRYESEVILKENLKRMMLTINDGLNPDIVNDAYNKLMTYETQNILNDNEHFHNLLINGIPVEYKRSDGTIMGNSVYLVDFKNPENNEFLVVNQFTVNGVNDKNRRPDLIIFINGMPLIVMELKNPSDERTTIKEAYNQIQTYIRDIPQLFRYNEMCVISDNILTGIGTISSDYNYFKQWKTMDGCTESSLSVTSAEVMVKGVFNKKILLDLIQNFIVFDKDTKGNSVKKMSAYHQYHAVNSAIATSIKASSSTGDGKGGVIWHTQGSGKSITMAFFTGKIIKNEEMKNPTIVVVTDRIDLDNQLYSTFMSCQDLFRQTPEHADSREELQNLLKRASGGVIFTTINKFFPETGTLRYPMLTDRDNVIVMVDEAHRSNYDFVDGFAAHMRDALPNATFIGFTGTPIDFTDRSTTNVFGSYISIYDIRKSIEDGTTVPIYYESRLISMDFPDDRKDELNRIFGELTEDLEFTETEAKKHKHSLLESLVGVDERVERVAEDIVKHFEKRQEELDGKAMVVCMSRRICVNLYDHIIKLRPDWKGDEDTSIINVIMTGSASDPLGYQDHLQKNKEKLVSRFKNPEDPFKIALVVDMWLTGFDIPCMHTMYFDKPMRAHGLMQAISRVNRVYNDKAGGLIVDYIGIADSLARAIGTYTSNKGTGSVIEDKSKVIEIFKENYEICCDLMHGYDWSWWSDAPKDVRTQWIMKPVDHILGLENGKSRYKEYSSKMKRAFDVANPDESLKPYRDGVQFFQNVRTALVKITGSGGGSISKEDIDEALRQALSSVLAADEPKDIMDILGYERADLSIISDDFIARIKKIPQKNLAAELMRIIIEHRLVILNYENITQTKKFSELIEESITKYEKRLIDTTEYINALIQLAREMNEALQRGEKLGLTNEELAFYDALGTDDAAVRLMSDDILRTIALEVAKSIEDNYSIDWAVRENVKSKMRVAIKRILKKYGYPPDKITDATDTILDQATSLCKAKEKYEN